MYVKIDDYRNPLSTQCHFFAKRKKNCLHVILLIQKLKCINVTIHTISKKNLIYEQICPHHYTINFFLLSVVTEQIKKKKQPEYYKSTISDKFINCW